VSKHGTEAKRVVNDVAYAYYLSGSQIEAEAWGNNLCIYLYDADGSPIGMQYRTTRLAEGVFYTFWFEKNLQGDIIAVYNDSGVKVLTYTYDAWGNILSISWSNSSGTNIYAQYNPFRYRGYYYDSELGMYYLQSRYYDPYTCRFINADGITAISATPCGLTDKNLFVYCDNNPVSRYDNDGEFWHVLIGAAIGAAVNFTASIVTDVIKGGWKNIDWVNAGISAGIGALEGGLSAAGVPVKVLTLVSAGCSAAESVYSDVKQNICEDGTNSVVDIVTHATINGGISALFTVAGGTSNGREMSAMYKSSKAAKKALKAGGLNPTVKKGMEKAVGSYSKALKAFTKDCLIDATISTPFSTFLTEYGTAKYDYGYGGK
jgi:RHS repeat-associated protein